MNLDEYLEFIGKRIKKAVDEVNKEETIRLINLCIDTLIEARDRIKQ